MKKKGNLIFVGIVASGKSSFIAALWHVVDSGELTDSLQIQALPSQREYLNALRTTWLDCGDLGRTVSEFGQEISLNVKNKMGSALDLVFPDLDGELYESHFANRFISPEFVEKLRTTSDIVLFINPDNLKKGDLISVADKALAKLNDEAETEGIGSDAQKIKPKSAEADGVDVVQTERGKVEEGDGNTKMEDGQAHSQEVEWDPKKHAPTQVVLVDLLQMILEYVEKPKISVIVSAWDLIMSLPKGDRKYPLDWLKVELPLLNQFFEANDDRLTYKIFGVSAQGSDYKDPAEKKMLQREPVPSKRIKVQLDTGEIVNDISMPIKWILDE